MRNPLFGEAEFAFDGKTFTVVFDTDALLAIEDDLDLALYALFDLLKQPWDTLKLGLRGSILAAGLARHHPDIDRSAAAQMLMDGTEATEATLQALVNMASREGDPGQDPPKPAPKTRAPANRGTGPKR